MPVLTLLLSPPDSLRTVVILPFLDLTTANPETALAKEAQCAAERGGSVLRYRVLAAPPTPQNLTDATFWSLPGPTNEIVRKWGARLHADFLLSGAIVAVNHEDSRVGKRVTVSLRLADAITGEMCNGAIATGSSPGGGQTTDPERRAVGRAVESALATLAQYPNTEATVLHVLDRERMLLAGGTNAGLLSGTNMSLIRGRRKVGEVRVIEVRERESVAIVLRDGPPQSGDIARAYFRFCVYPSPRRDKCPALNAR